MSHGTPPRDSKFLDLLEKLPEDGMFIYDIPDPEARVKGLYQHPLQRVVRNHGSYHKKKFHSFKWLNKLYVVRLPVPNEEALRTPISSQGVQHEQDHQGTDVNDDGKDRSDARNVRPAGSGSNHRP